MFEWKPDMIRFMRTACEYGSYNRELAEIMMPFLDENSHICDAGCGLGYLSLELAKEAGKVTAVDVSRDALAVLQENCDRQGIHNIQILCGDVLSLRFEEKFTAMVFCYFGNLDGILECYDRLCSGPVFIFMRNYETHRFSEGKYQKVDDGFSDACTHLKKLGIPFRSLHLENEFGQPFRNLDEARRFYDLYSLDKERVPDVIVQERLVETGREDYPLYLPHRKKTGCIILNSVAE